MHDGWTRETSVIVNRILAGLFVAVVMAGGAAVAGPSYEDAYKRGDDATALRLAQPLAEQGNDAAQLFLGYIYSLGGGVPQDYAEAAKWFRLAAEQGNAEAQWNLAMVYELGEGVLEDYAEAAKWHRLSAEQGYAYAQYNLGNMYEEGKGVLQNYVLARNLTWPPRRATRRQQCAGVLSRRR
jgi:TPR repeat protein